jgi:hypothetical protein
MMSKVNIIRPVGSGLFGPPSDPPPVNLDWPGEPEGFTVRADNDWESLPGEWAGGDTWGHQNIGTGVGSIESDGSAPEGSGTILRAFYPEDHSSGTGAIRTGHRFGTYPSELYYGIWWRASSNWTNHPVATKLHYANWRDQGSGSQHFFWLDWWGASNANPSNSYIRLKFQGTWVERDYWQNVETVRQNVAPHVSVEAGGDDNFYQLPKDQWVQFGVYMKKQDTSMENGIVRVWQRNLGDEPVQLVEITDHVFPGDGVYQIYHEGTFGGADFDVPQDQWWDVAHTRLSVPGV